MGRPEQPTRRGVVGGALASAMAAMPARAQTAAKPNIVYIMADDLGYADLSSYGRREYKTPNIDSIATHGLKLTQGYSNSAICSPTRTALLTGRYQYRLRVGLDEPIAAVDSPLAIPAGFPTLPVLLKRAGYRTSLVGKWHLGDVTKAGPLTRGYDRFFGIPAGGADYFRHKLVLTDKATAPDGLWDGDRKVERPGYMTDILGDRAVQEIEEYGRGKQPFFMSLHFTAPHWPWEGPEDEAVAAQLSNPQHYDGGSLATYAKMMRNLDDNVGKVLAALERAGLANNTIVVFTSDNGGERFSDTWPLIGMKGELLEGGIRVPVLVRWPGRIPQGSTSDQVMISMDWVPTFLAAAGGRADPAYPLDGEDLLPVLTGRAPPRPRKLFWRMKGADQAAVRDANWKYLRLGGKEHLFDLAAEGRERANLKAVRPDVFERLKADYERWNATMLPYPADVFANHPGRAGVADRY